jgi:chromosomal replication initiation ATPase DnaA
MDAVQRHTHKSYHFTSATLMLNAHQLDSEKFSPTFVDVNGINKLKKIQDQVRDEVMYFERSHIEMLFGITDNFIPKEDIEQKKVDDKFLNDREKFKIIYQVVADQSGMSMQELKGNRHFRRLVIPRWIVMFLTRWATDLSMEDIGRAIVNGVRLNHSTICYGCRQMKDAIESRDEKIYPILQKIIHALRAEGIYINLKSEFPVWYQRLLEKEK